MKVKVIGSNPGYLLNHSLLYAKNNFAHVDLTEKFSLLFVVCFVFVL